MGAARAEGDSYAEFVRALGGDVRHDAIERGGGDDQGERPEQTKQSGAEPPRSYERIDSVLHRANTDQARRRRIFGDDRLQSRRRAVSRGAWAYQQLSARNPPLLANWDVVLHLGFLMERGPMCVAHDADDPRARNLVATANQQTAAERALTRPDGAGHSFPNDCNGFGPVALARGKPPPLHQPRADGHEIVW